MPLVDGGQNQSPCFCGSRISQTPLGLVVVGVLFVVVGMGVVVKRVVGCELEMSFGPLEHPLQEKSTWSQDVNK